MFDPYSVKEGARVDTSGMGPLALGDAIRKLARRALTIEGGVVVYKAELEEFRRAEQERVR